jgi:hypothetical protein
MADLPKYQSSVMFSDVPQLDFANVRESFKRSQSMSTGLDRLSEFAFKKAGEVALEQAAEYSVNNPPTPEQIELAKTGSFNPKDLVPGGGAIFQKAVSKLQAGQLRNSLEIDVQNQYMSILNDVKNKKITSKAELDAKLEAPRMGMSKVISGLDPEEAIKFKASTAASGFQIGVAANRQFEENFKEENDALTISAVTSGIDIIREASKNLGTSNPEMLRGQIALVEDKIKKAGLNGTDKITNQEWKRWEDEKQGLALSGLDKTKEDVVRLAATGNPKAEQALNLAVSQIEKYSDIMAISPEYREKYKMSVIEDFHIARLESEYDKAPNKEKFLKAVSQDMKRGPVGDLFDKNGMPSKQDRLTRGIDLPKLQALENKFEADIRSRRAEYNSLKSELNGDIAEVQRIASLGAPISQTAITQLAARARNLGLPGTDNISQKINTLATLNADTEAYKKMNSVQLKDIQRKWEQDTANGATLMQAERLNHIRQFTAAFEDGLKKDPVAMMNKSGIPVNTLNFAADDKDFKMQVSDRASKAKIYAEQQGIKPQFFTNDEAGSLATYLQTADVNQQLGMIAKITNSFGKDAPKAMSEISKFSPEYAHIGGLVMTGASQLTVKDALNGIKQRQAGNKAFEVGGDAAAKRQSIADRLGGAYYNAPQTRNNIVTVADAIYTQRAITMGITQFSDEMYSQAFQEAAGAVKFKDKTWYGGAKEKVAGGIIDYKGMKLPIPNNIAQDEFEELIGKATYKDFQAASNGTLTDAKGRPYSVERLRDAMPAPINTDESFLYYGEYRGVSNPQQFYTKDGAPVKINYRKLANIVKSRQ